jgi:phosphoglycolate phosphatase-like HAD superfamily hydrolase
MLSGRTDLAITLEVFRTNGVSPSDGVLEEFRAATVAAFVELDGELRARGRPLPGAVAALAALTGTAVQSLLTGNIRAVAEAKMAAFGLGGYLDPDSGAYGWSSAVRADLVELARAAASGRHGRAFAGRRTVLVGDTPRDVEAALASGASVVGVATGHYTVADLADAGAHAVLPDLTATDAVLTAIREVTT